MDIADRAAIAEHRQGAIERALSSLDEPNPRACCIDCDEPIDPRRRAALPGACRCLRCAEARETR